MICHFRKDYKGRPYNILEMQERKGYTYKYYQSQFFQQRTILLKLRVNTTYTIFN